ncbi:hypothetical protein F5Y16DRAFT_34469 [Xylariaceae sp. FL0255]|nr:hypothetical protein F5Y16DRAFT_34469 [Xylariaceae sp. FL0255]
MAIIEQRIAALEAELERYRPKRRRKVLNPNKKFMGIGEILAAGPSPNKEDSNEGEALENEESSSEEDVVEIRAEEPEDPKLPAQRVTRSRRQTQRPSRYND